MRRTPSTLLLLAFLSSCGGAAPISGIRATPSGDGPRVNWNVSEKPLPNIPFPNDIATWPDPDSPTGRRVNASLVGMTALETKMRRRMAELDGFGILAPLWVSFDAQLDLQNIRNRHKQDRNFSDDAFYIVNIDPSSKKFGQPVVVDMGWGNYPVVAEKTNKFSNDFRPEGSNFVLETEDEQLSGKDTNFDGILSRSNMDPRDGNPYDDLVTFYEFATDSLIMRPLYSLEEASEYAVILTERLTGADGNPVRSPFMYVNHSTQTPSLKRLNQDGILDGLGLTLDDVAFAWTFTTQSVTKDLVAIRKGMEGLGPFAWLATEFPPDVFEVEQLKEEPLGTHLYMVEGARMGAMLERYGSDLFGFTEPQIGAMLDALAYVDYIVAGTFIVPNFLGNEDELFTLNAARGDAKLDGEVVTWWMSVPKAVNGFAPPFPIGYVSHGYTSNRLEAIGYMGTFAKFGFACVGMDSVGHGGMGSAETNAMRYLLEEFKLGKVVDNVIAKGRARDLNNDGKPDSGGDFWTADTFRTRDVVRQSAVDYFQATRMFRSFDGERRWKFDLNDDGEKELAGDFNADGVVDVGGPWNLYVMTGGSLGGILSGVVPAIEPWITVAAPIAGGGGLSDIAVRSRQGGVAQAVLLRMMGPLVVTLPDPETGALRLAFHVASVNDDLIINVAELHGAAPGDRLEVLNHRTGETYFGILNNKLRTRLHVESDEGDRYTATLFRGNVDADGNYPEVKERIETFQENVDFEGRIYANGSTLRSISYGFGLKRQTPSFRRFTQLAQMILEPADPASYGKHFFLEPLEILPDGPRPKNVLQIPTVGDMNVPVSTGLTMARATGVIPTTVEEAQNSSFSYGPPAMSFAEAGGFDKWYASKYPWNAWRAAAAQPETTTPSSVFVDNYVAEALDGRKRFDEREILFDPDDLDEGLDGFDAPDLATPLRITRRMTHGISAIRMPYMKPSGQHGFGMYSPDKPFDIDTYMHNMIGHYARTGGRELIDDICLEDNSCGFLPPPIPRSPKPADL